MVSAHLERTADIRVDLVVRHLRRVLAGLGHDDVLDMLGHRTGFGDLLGDAKALAQDLDVGLLGQVCPVSAVSATQPHSSDR